MKKKLLIVLLSIIICSPFSVYAKDQPFYKKFQTESITSGKDSLYYATTMELNNSYIILNEYSNPYDEYDISITLDEYTYQGKKIKSSEIENYYLIEVTSDSNYIYVLCESNESIELKKVDSNLNIIKNYVFTQEQEDAFYDYDYNYDYYYIVDKEMINIKNNKINIYAGKEIFQFDLELAHLETLAVNESAMKNLFYKSYKASHFGTYIYDNNSSYQAYYDEGICQNAIYDDNEQSCTPAVKFLDNNDNFLWNITFPEDRYYTSRVYDVKIIENYLVILQNHYDDEYSEFLIYDFEGNEIQKIRSETMHNKINPNSFGFSALNVEGPLRGDYPCPEKRVTDQPTIKFRQELEPYATISEEDYCTYKSHEEFYYLYYLIDSKITGSGRVEVKNKAKIGEEVEFRALADSNFTAKNVSVRDINGSPIKVTNNKFIMPEEDVIIEAEFVSLRNPSTKTGLLCLFTIILISILSFSIIKIKKSSQKNL